jgi:6-phosphogluconolactonase
MQPLTVRALWALVLALLFAGCSGNGSTAIAPSGSVPDSLTHLTRSAGPDVSMEYVYVTNAGSNTVSIFSIGSLGVLTAVGLPVTAGSGPRGVAVAADSQDSFLYVANNGSNTISAFHITAGTGALTPVTTSPFAAHGTAPNGVATIGKCVFTTNGGSGDVSAFYIKGSPHHGALMWKANYSAGSHPENIVIDAASSFHPFVYVTNETSNSISAYSAVSTYPCTLTPVAGSPFATAGGPFGVAVDPTGARAVVANLSVSSVSFFNIGGGGALTPTGTIAAGGTHPVGVAISGTYAFVPNESSDTVSAYNVAGTVSGSPVTTDHYPQGVAVDPSGLYAYVANESTNDVSAYTIVSGVLSAVTGSPFATGGTSPEYVATCETAGNSCKPPPL